MEGKEKPQKKKKPVKDEKIYRYPEVGWFGGVCAGIAYKLKIQTWIVRLVTFLAILFLEVPLLVYIIFWIFMPSKELPKDYDKICK